jgi:hypothetical protein
VDGTEEDWLEQLVEANTRAGQTPHPLTVMSSRYGGCYEGDYWVAFNCYPHDISPAAYGDDLRCSGFWGFGADHQPQVGRGATPNQAIADLVERLKDDWTG